MRVAWNREQEGFRKEWLWQFGEGPFDIVQVIPVPETPRFLGVFKHNQVEICWEPGRWFFIRISKDSYFHKVHDVVSVRFHEKWFSPIFED